jgi:NTP pyrophosphatase (non-canonical NTP hydrolase)
MALNVEVAEIAEHFQWLTEEESKNLTPVKLAKIKEEIGDAMIFLLNLSDKLGINPLGAAIDKLEKNRLKYPVNKAKGNAIKYSEYE